MGVRWFFLLWMFFCVCTLRFISVTAQEFTMCDIQQCHCTIKAASWKIVNCSLHEGQIVNFENAKVPNEAVEIYVTGGREITFASKTFNGIRGLSLIYIDGTQKIVMENKSFYHITSSSLLIQIKNCDELIIKTGAFDYLQSSVSTEVFDVNFASIESAAFCQLYNSTFKNVRLLKLQERAFDFKNERNKAATGPVSVIIFENVEIQKIPSEVFLTPLASVSFHNCKIGEILQDAFKGFQISSIIMDATTIENVHEGAFTGRTLICDFKITNCSVSTLHSNAILAAVGNFSLSHSIVTDIESGAINATVARSEICNNEIFNIHPTAIVINNWNVIDMENNIIKHLYANFLLPLKGADNEKLSFKGNEIYNMDETALGFLSNVDTNILTFDDNFFNQTCDCFIDAWIEKIANSNQLKLIKGTSFCTVNAYLSNCFSLPIGIINIQNFTEKSCKNLTVCEPYEGKTRIVDTTSKIFVEEDDSAKQSWLIFMITIISLFIVAIVVTFIILLIRGGRWLKDKGYFRNVHYNNNDLSIEEGTVVTVDENEKLEIPDELTLEFLQILSKRLDDPATHQDASEMIERLYEMFIIEDGYENNNRQEEEAHLYEELGNLNLQIPPPPYEEDRESAAGARSILKLMEEKFSQQVDVNNGNGKPPVMSDYSEPTDAAVHLYSELKNKGEKSDNKGSTDCLKSNESLNNSKNDWLSKPGPSTKL
ncbi:uncharacterized protein LOC130452678 [Diorhabda sublineata]|uniref:uncharacterized protein LOC130452678 n=1 Tax=Diorhabda sublineata TaxID=1163346 RepID=UPI0024E0FB05|nr:uncharacterized protein LOC130452678 [Diorhabda sublineata]